MRWIVVTKMRASEALAATPLTFSGGRAPSAVHVGMRFTNL
jgi:hypothetical protein